MGASSDLFDLVKSLTKSEKRYFRMSASFYARNGGSRYLHLFDMIDRQEEYDEDMIRTEFAERFGTAHFSEAKYYLYNAILKSLHAGEADNDVEVRLAIALHQAKILFRRKLFRQCSKMVRRIASDAEEYELWPIAAKARQIEFQLVTEHGIAAEGIDTIIDDVPRYGALWRETMDYWSTFARLLYLRNMAGIPRNAEQLRAYDKALHKGRESHGKEPASVAARLFQGYSTAFLLEAKRDYRGALETYRSLLSIVESSRYWTHGDNIAVAPILCCICMMSVFAADIETFWQYYPMILERTSTNPESAHYQLHITGRAFGVEILTNIGEFDRALEHALELERCMNAYRGEHRTSVVTHYLFAMHDVYFGLGDHVRCVEYTNAVLAFGANRLDRTRYMNARIRQLIDHFELENFTLLESLLRSLHRYMVMNGYDFGSERAILSLVRRALRTAPGRDQEMLFRSFLEEIEPLLDDPFELNFGFWRTIICWLESRIERRPYAKVVREKYLKEFVYPAIADAERSLDHEHATV